MSCDESGANLAVLPCRGGSKRIPKKNIRPFHNRPLLAYSIDAALESGVFSSVVVSTDSMEIAEIARSCGAEVPFLRVSTLADDFTPASAVTLDALKLLDATGAKFARVAQLMVNCPLRSSADIRDSYRQFMESGADTQISVTEYGWLNPWWAMTRDEENRLSMVFREQALMRSQDQPAAYCPTGAIWWAKVETLREHGTFYAPGYQGWTLPWQRAVDIDNEEDWKMAEFLKQAGM